MSRLILVVDDNEDNVNLLRLILQNLNLEVHATESVTEAEVMAADETYSLVLLDSRLPDGDGTELCRRLRQKHPGLPIIFNSASAHREAISQAMEAGADAYITKPTDFDELIRVIHQHILRGRHIP